MNAPAVIDDLSNPTFSAEAAEVLAMMDTVAEFCPLDSAALHAQASAEVGLTDFGPRDYEERLDLLLQCYRDVPGLSKAGQVNIYAQVVQLLKNRLLLAELLRTNPEIHDLELAQPLVIAGLPRTGTTHLLQLLASTGLFRTLPYWESLEPFPLPGEVGIEARRERTAGNVAVMNQALPHLIKMHEMEGPDHIHEEIALLACDFSTMYFETFTEVPAWVDYYETHDQAPHYRYLKLQLQALQHLRPGGRWLLKSPQHLEQLPVLKQVFPDATVIVTHRDPAHVVTSMATMVAYTERMFRAVPDPCATGHRWAERLEVMLGALAKDRDILDPARSLDLPFTTFMADQIGSAERVLALAGETPSADVRAAMEHYLATHPAGHLGRVDYRPELVGLDAADLTARFAEYSARFLPN